MPLKKLFLLCTLCLYFPLYALNKGHELINAPSALMQKKGFLESGITTLGGTSKTKGLDINTGLFLRIGITDSLEYSVTAEKSQTLHHAQLQLFKQIENSNSQYLAIGIKNIGYKELDNTLPSQPLNLGGYFVYSFQGYKGAPIGHIGMGQDRLSTQFLTFGGIEYPLWGGSFAMDYDGYLIGIGFNFIIDSHYRFSAGYEFQFNEDPTKKPEQFKASFSILDFGESPTPSITEPLKPSQNISGLISKKIGTLPTPSSAVSPNKTTSVNIAPTASVFSKIASKKLSLQSEDSPETTLSDAKDAINYLQRGMSFYYKGDIEAAIGEYSTLSELMPTLPIAHSSLGSLYYKLGQTRLAVDEWQKALQLDPANAKLDSLVHHALKLLKNPLESEIPTENQTDTYKSTLE